MQCSQCLHENPAGQKFCGECGTRLQAVCPSCRTANPPGQKFCGECGERLTAPVATLKSLSPSPDSYTPPHLAERIISSRGALEGASRSPCSLGQHGQPQSLAQLQEAEALAIALDDQHRLGQVSVQMAQHYWQTGDYHRAVAAGQRGLAIGEAVGDPTLQATASFHQGQATYGLGNYGRAGALFAQCASSLTMRIVSERPGFAAGFQGAGFREAAFIMLGRVYHALGQYGRAEEYLRASIAAAGDAPLREYPGQPFVSSVSARVWLAYCAAERGDFRTAQVLGEEGLRIARTVGQPWSLITDPGTKK